jgi:putative two-component system response regulator
MRILVVDDNDIDLAVARKVLQNFGHEVLTAGDGLEAVDLIQRHGIRAVISDWNMPFMNGIDLCKKIRSGLIMGYVYIILVTVRNSREDMVAGLSAGADDFITKPFDPAELQVRVKNAERVLSLETSVMTIFSMAKLAESRDPETGLHLERIQTYSRVLAEEIMARGSNPSPISHKFAELIYQTSPLHDIGKVGIPDHVLLKPGRLDDNEFEIMKKHTQIGAETLEATLKHYPGAEFLHLARDIAWAHHEKFDGGGYPRGLKGEEIPLCARIVALADVYDALTMKRCYKSAYPHDVARGIILKGEGDHFDPQVIQAFLKNEDRFQQIRETFSE